MGGVFCCLFNRDVTDAYTEQILIAVGEGIKAA
jgi:alkyl hydroperoxide reductase subunit AhpF